MFIYIYIYNLFSSLNHIRLYMYIYRERVREKIYSYGKEARFISTKFILKLVTCQHRIQEQQ